MCSLFFLIFNLGLLSTFIRDKKQAYYCLTVCVLQACVLLNLFLNQRHMNMREWFSLVNITVHSGMPRFQEEPFAVTGYLAFEDLVISWMDEIS